MAALNGITIKPEIRPCLVKDKNCKEHKALFHKWGQILAVDGFGHYKADITMGIVEYEDGAIHTVYPCDIKFIDYKMGEYCMDYELHNVILKARKEGDNHDIGTKD